MPTPTPLPCATTDLGCIPTDPVGFVSKFYSIGLGIVGGVAILSIIYGGYVLMTSRGNPAEIDKGRRAIMYAIIGLLLAVFGYVFTQVITVDILHIPGFDG